MSAPPKAPKPRPPFPRDGLDIKPRAARLPLSRTGHYHKPLKTKFRLYGFDYRRIARAGDIAIYEQTFRGNTDSAAFEVINVQRHDGLEIKGKYYPPAEFYPHSESWGLSGWTYTEKEDAFGKLRELVSLKVGRRPC